MIMFQLREEGRESRRGSALVTVMVVLAVLLLLLAGFMRLVGSAHSEQGQQRDGLQVQYAAEAGLGESFLELEEGRDPTLGASAAEPRELDGVRYWVESEDQGTRVIALRASAQARTTRERIELV